MNLSIRQRLVYRYGIQVSNNSFGGGELGKMFWKMLVKYCLCQQYFDEVGWGRVGKILLMSEKILLK